MLWQEKFPSNLHRHLISQVLQTFYMEQMNYSTTCFCLCWKTAKVLSMASLSHFLSLSVLFLHVLLFSFRNLFPSSLSQHPCILPHNVCASVCFLVFLFSINISHWTFCESCYLSCQSPLLILILTKKTDILELFESIKFMYRYLLIYHTFPPLSFISFCYSNWWGKGSRWPVALLPRSRWHWMWAALR